jgi:hypothetical protein
VQIIVFNRKLYRGRSWFNLVDILEAFIWTPIGFFIQYYANGEAWYLPDGAYEALYLLKDAGGYIN